MGRSENGCSVVIELLMNLVGSPRSFIFIPDQVCPEGKKLYLVITKLLARVALIPERPMWHSGTSERINATL